MKMKFKITAIDTTSMKVEYSDGTWAEVPSQLGAEKEYYLRAIQNLQPKSVAPVSLKDHPMKIGDEGVVGEGIPEEFVHQNDVEEIDYGAARVIAYPTVQRQLEALYDARIKKDDTKQKAIDGHIAIVKAKFPVNDTLYDSKAIDEALTELKKDSKWTDD